MSTHANRVKMTTATTGTGTITLGSASTGYQSFADAFGANATVDILIVDGTAWEIARNCTYTHSGTTLSRGTWEDSSNGTGAITLSGSAVVSVIAAAEFGNNAEMAIQAVTPGGRLTTESGVPVSTSDRTAQSTLYYTPFVHNIINLWDGSQWKPITFTEHTVTGGTLSGLTSGKPYDVFAYLSSGALATELLVWTNDTTRATAVTLQDGRYCKSGDKTRLLLGTIYTTGTTTTADSVLTRYVSNVYNRKAKALTTGAVTGANHTYNTATWREWNGGTSVTRLEWVDALDAQTPVMNVFADISNSASASYASVYIDTTSGDPSESISSGTTAGMRLGGSKLGATPMIAAGHHYATAAQYAQSATGTFTNYWLSGVIQQ